MSQLDRQPDNAAPVHAVRRGALAHLTLDRPRALNALNGEMCELLTEALLGFASDESVACVAIDGAGGRAFCAGGDVVMLHDSGKVGDGRAESFWRTEYALNELIHRYAKPYVALIDGIVMGGGVGMSVHGRYRVAGDTTLFAMPETGIGYFPDVGGSFFLPRLGEGDSLAIGNWLGLTGARLGPSQCLDLDIATHFVPTERHADLLGALAAGGDVQDILGDFHATPPDGEPVPDTVQCFDRASVAAIIDALEADGSDWALAQLGQLRRKSPLALCVTFEAMRRGRRMSFREAMTQELDLSLNFLATQDFYEGIRAQLIDKDRKPQWSHDGVDTVTDEQVARMFRNVAEPPQAFLD